MRKTIRKTSEEIRKEWTPERIASLKSKDFPSFSSDVTEEDMMTGRVKKIGQGFASYRKHANHAATPKSPVKKVTIRLPEAVVMDMRATQGYCSLLSDYIMSGILSGKLKIPTLRRQT
jgi:hypothetical protein